MGKSPRAFRVQKRCQKRQRSWDVHSRVRDCYSRLMSDCDSSGRARRCCSSSSRQLPLDQQEVDDRLLLIRHLLARRDNGGFESLAAGAGLVLHVLGDRTDDELLDLPQVLVEKSDDLLGGDMLAGVVEPAV